MSSRELGRSQSTIPSTGVHHELTLLAHGSSLIQIEMNRSLYESDESSPSTGSITNEVQIVELNEILKNILGEWIRDIL